MKTYRITYKNYDLKNSNIERSKKDLKNLFWIKGSEPANWNQFDNEIVFFGKQDRGGDCIEITFSENVSENWKNAMLKALKNKRDIRSIEIKKSNFEYKSF